MYRARYCLYEWWRGANGGGSGDDVGGAERDEEMSYLLEAVALFVVSVGTVKGWEVYVRGRRLRGFVITTFFGTVSVAILSIWKGMS